MPRHHDSFKFYSAFSLIELSITLAIIGIVAAIAGPRYSNSLARYRVAAAAQRIAADINLARTQAKIASTGQSIVFNISSNSYSLPGVTGLGGAGQTYTVKLASDPYSAKLGSATQATLTFNFDRFGQIAAGGTLSVQSGAFSKTVVVDSTSGLVTIQ